MKRLVFLFSSLLAMQGIFSQTITVNAESNILEMAHLKEGTSKYVVYFTDSLHRQKTSGDIWERTTTFAALKDRPVVHFSWNWYHHDVLQSQIINICNQKTLAPVFHKAIYNDTLVVAYDFNQEAMIPSDTVPRNVMLGREGKKLGIPIISWEQDLETFPLLPITKIGQEFKIAFFDPNKEAATYHRYKVIDQRSLKLAKDVEVLCWVLKIEYDASAYGLFWISSESREFLKSQEYFNGHYRYKVKLF